MLSNEEFDNSVQDSEMTYLKNTKKVKCRKENTKVRWLRSFSLYSLCKEDTVFFSYESPMYVGVILKEKIGVYNLYQTLCM